MTALQQYEIHPIASIFPEMTPAEKKDLKSDVLANGIQVPAVLFEGQVADGRNRYEVWSELLAEGKEVSEFPVIEFQEDEDRLLRYVISANLKRRHMNAGQRAAIAGQASLYASKRLNGHDDPPTEAGPRSRKPKAGKRSESQASASSDSGDTSGHGDQRVEANGNGHGEPAARGVGRPPKLNETSDAIADSAGVSRSYAADAVRIGEQDPELLRKVAAGDVTLPEAKRQLRKQSDQAAAPPVDGVGTPLPPRLIPVFESAKRLDEFDRQLSQIRKGLQEIGESDAGVYLPLDRIVTELSNARQGIKHSKPYAVCGACQGKGCAKCKSKCGYVTKAVYERIDAE